MKKQYKYIIEILLGFIAYGVGLITLNQFFEPGNSYWLVLFVFLPLIYVATVIIRYVVKMDELQRKIIIEAMAFSGLTTGFSCFNYLFLRNMGAPEFKAEWAFYAMWLFFAVGLVWSTKRYR